MLALMSCLRLRVPEVDRRFNFSAKDKVPSGKIIIRKCFVAHAGVGCITLVVPVGYILPYYKL